MDDLFAAAFDKLEHADVHLHLSTADEAEASVAKKLRTQDLVATHARSYHLHSIILSTRSKYFQGRLGSHFNVDSCSSSSSASSSQIRFEIVHHLGEEELDAVELLLRAMYDIEVDASTDVTLLLGEMKQSDFFLPSKSFVQLLYKALDAIPIDAITVDGMHLAMSERFGTVHPLPEEFWGKCLPRLVEVFGNVPDVVELPDLLSLFCALKHASVLAWAEADLQVHSENDVAYVLTKWLEAQARGGVSSCSEGQVQQLADCFVGWKAKPGTARLLDSEVPQSFDWVSGFLGERLCKVFGNVPAVVMTQRLLTRFCALPHSFVMSWVSCESLQVHSENDVVYLLTEWARAQTAAGMPCSAAELEQLVDKLHPESACKARLHWSGRLALSSCI
ncbi:hypothetical protein FOA52_003642 [Chlamydomonas sp. UWO 241]|nr:hypothetical protein FOA52_003642 [Chlamydomonas sp. UWO 241]